MGALRTIREREAEIELRLGPVEAMYAMLERYIQRCADIIPQYNTPDCNIWFVKTTLQEGCFILAISNAFEFTFCFIAMPFELNGYT